MRRSCSHAHTNCDTNANPADVRTDCDTNADSADVHTHATDSHTDS